MSGLDREYREGFCYLEKTLMYATKRPEDFGNHGKVTGAPTICGKFGCELPNRNVAKPHGFITLHSFSTGNQHTILRPLGSAATVLI